MASLDPYRHANEPDADLVFTAPLVREVRLFHFLFGAKRRKEIRLERVGARHRLRLGPELVIRGPFTLAGASCIDEWRRLFMVLEVRGANDTGAFIGATAAEWEPAPTREDWFDGALMEQPGLPDDFVVATPHVLLALRDALVAADLR